jgi:hypothetical protein
MASFTDKISQFNPFIAELPAQEMVQVGMYKQKQYDAGIQKVQGYINNIAGMDVYNDGDKELIQSKLNQLGNNLKTVAAGDFSNQQLVNSVGGMATQLVKDPMVQNAVLNTTKFRKTLAQIEKDKADGKAGKNNIDDFYAQAQPWMESTTPGAKLSASYSQYRDVNKKAMEAIKALHPNLKSIDIPFVVKDGKIDTQKIADAMKRNKVEGITEGQIVTAIRASLSPEDYNQLDIDGRRTFASVPTDRLVSLVDTNLRSVKEQNGIEIQRLKAQLPAQLQDPNKTDELNKRIKWYEEQGYIIGNDVKDGTLDEEAKDDREFAASNPNKVKESLYRQGFFQQYGNAFKWASEDFKYEDNPFKKVDQWNKEMNLKWTAENRQRTQGERKLAIDEAQLEIDKEELKIKKEEAYGTPGIPVEEGNETDNVLKSDERLLKQIDGITGDVIAKRQQLINKGYTVDQVNSMVTDYQKNGNKANIPATVIGTVQDILKQTKYLNDLDNLRKTTKAEADAEVESNEGIKATVAEKEKFIKDNFDTGTYITMNFGGGKTKIMNAAALMRDINDGKIGYQVDKAPLGQMYVTVDGVTASFPKVGVGSNPQLKAIIDKAIVYQDKYGKFDKDLTVKKDQRFKEKLAPRVAELVPTITAIGFGKDKTIPTSIANNLASFIKAADSKEIAADEDFDSGVAGNMLVGDNLKNTKVFLRQTGTGYQAVLSDMTGKEKDQVLNLDQGKAIKLFGAQYVDTQKEEALKLRAGRGSNNINGGPENAPLQTQYGDFPNINKYQLTAQLDEDSKYTGTFVPTVHLLKKDGSYQSFEISGKNRAQRLGYDQGKQQLSNLTDDTMMKLLKELYPTYDFSQIYRK